MPPVCGVPLPEEVPIVPSTPPHLYYVRRAYPEIVSTRYRWAIGGVLAALAIVAIPALLVTHRERARVQVQTADVGSGPIARRVLVSGTLEPARMVEVGSQVSGTIASLPAGFNSRVKAGQVLAQLDPASFQARLVEAEAGLAKAQAERARRQAALDDARMKLEDAEALAGDQQLARAELDLARTTMQQAVADVKGADADIAAARAAMTQAQVSLDRTVIRSPIDGVVIGRHVEVGQTIAASVRAPVLFTIGDLRRMRLLAEVPEGEVGGVQRGSQVRFDIESIGGHPFTGTVAEVRLAPQVAASTAPSAGGSSNAGASSNAGTGATSTANTPVATSGSSPAGTGDSAQAAGSSMAGTTAAQPASQTSSLSPAALTTSARQTARPTGVVTYIAVIDVDASREDIPPGGTAIVTLAGSERAQAVRIPNNALTFAPSTDSFAAVDQEPPVLKRAETASTKHTGTRRGYVWKFENNRFVPIEVETGIADESWTELVSGDVRPGDRLVTAAAPLKRSS
jgi:HlyD family secretion protein